MLRYEVPNILLPLCLSASPIQAGCSSDDECPLSQACRNRACINPCIQENPCSSSARCTVSNHKPICNCPSGTEGDPYSRCAPSKFASLEIEYLCLNSGCEKPSFIFNS